MNLPLDEFERRILLAVQDNGRLSVNDLAERIGLSSSPTWRRLRALEERGVIRRYVALLDPALAGVPQCVFTHITLVKHDRAAIVAFETAMLARQEVLECFATTGDADYLLRIMVADTAAFDATDFDQLDAFFGELPTPIDHVLVTGPGPYYAPLADVELDRVRDDVESHLLLPLAIARNAIGRVRPGGTLLFMGGTGGRSTAPGMSVIGALTAAIIVYAPRKRREVIQWTGIGLVLVVALGVIGAQAVALA